MIKPFKVLRALKLKWSVPLFVAYWGAVFVMMGGITLPGPEWINWVVVMLPAAVVVLLLAGALIIISYAGAMSVRTFFFGKRLRRRVPGLSGAVQRHVISTSRSKSSRAYHVETRASVVPNDSW